MSDKKQIERRWIPVADHLPDTVIERHRARTLSADAHGAYMRRVMEKAAREGVIHVDPDTGYQARFPVGKVPKELRFVDAAA